MSEIFIGVGVVLVVTKILFPTFFQLKTFFDSRSITNQIDLRGTVVIVTGANTGIGKSTASKLAVLGSTVILACRDENKGAATEKEINDITRNICGKSFPFAKSGSATCMALDFSNLGSVISFIEKLSSKFNRINFLINNAGAAVGCGRANSIGVDDLCQTNYLGHYLLTRLVLPILAPNEKSARIINLSSIMHHFGVVKHSVDLLGPSEAMYAKSKFYMNLFTYELNRRYSKKMNVLRNDINLSSVKKDVVAISVNPGGVKSDIWRHVYWPVKDIYNAFMNLFYYTVDEGALPSVLATVISDEELLRLVSARSPTSSVPSSVHHHHSFLPYFAPVGRLAQVLAWLRLLPPPKPRLVHSSIPNNIEDISSALWLQSEEACKRALGNNLKLPD